MQKYFMLLIAAILILSCAACTQSDRQRLDAALSGDCPAKINALDVLLPELEDDAVRQEAERALLVCRTEIERVKVQQLFEEPEKNLEELLRMQIELKSAGRAGLIENAYNGFLSKLFAEGELERAEKLYKLLLKRGLLHATNTSYAKAFINCKYEGCYPLAKKAFAEMLSENKYPQAREEIYRVWLEVTSRYGTPEELEEATFVVPCIFGDINQTLMQISMEYQVKAADMRRAAGMPERVVGKLDCDAFHKKQAELVKIQAPSDTALPATEENTKTEK